jgi:hypothetical protein
MARVRRSLRSLFVGRGLFDIAVWIAALLIAAVSLVRAIRTGEGLASAVFLAVVAVAYTFKPWVGRIQRARPEEEAAGSLTIDEWGVTRVAGGIHEAVAWKDLVWVRIYTTSAGPAAEDVYFALAGANGKGCLVPHDLAVRAKLLDALAERLPGLDNDLVIRAMGSGDDTYFTIWSRGPAPN